MKNAIAQVEPLELRRDPRGWSLESLGATALPLQRATHVALTLPGQVRGNHLHRHATETLVVVGPALVRVREAGRPRDIAVSADQAVRILIPPGVTHAYKNTGTAPAVLVAFSTEPPDRVRPDFERDVLIER